MEANARTLKFELENAHQLSEINAGWNLDSVQLEPGRFHMVNEQIVFSDLVLERYASNLAKKDEYRLPEATTLITFLSPGSSNGHWCGFEISSNVALINQSGRDHFAVLPGPFEAVSLLISNQLIDSWELIPADFVDCRAASRQSIIPLNQSNSEPFLHWLFSIFRSNKSNMDQSNESFETQRLHDQLLVGVGSVIGPGLTNQRLRNGKPRYFRRFELVQRACELIGQRASETLSTRQLASELAVNARTLQRGFEDVLKTSIFEYTQAIKLGAVRRELLQSRSRKTTVSSVALKHGFAEFGRFSARYRSMFEELPSETVRRTRAWHRENNLTERIG